MAAPSRPHETDLAPEPPPTVLFLQGPPSRFWTELADALEARGAGVRRVNLCLADRLFWRRPGAVDYRGRLREFRRWLGAFCAREGVTDILYYADRLPYHRLAAKVARTQGLRAHALEFGYLRPDWVTLEREGGGAFSHFPADPARLRADLPAPDLTVRYPHRFGQEATGEVIYNLAMTAGRPLYPFYATDKYYPPVFDYLCWLPKLARARGRRRHAKAVQRAWLDAGAPFTLVALQMQSDYQLRASAPYRRQRDMAREIVDSFAAHAPPGHRLLFKVHPLDNGWEDWRAIVRDRAAARGAADRVEAIDGGDLGRLLGAARGAIVANSTVGLHALRAGRPVKALGAAVYDMPGLTDPRPLHAFWADPAPPDPATLDAFLRTLAHEIQIKGSIYHAEGRRLAVAEAADRIVGRRVGPAGAGVRPPRLDGLLAMRRARGAPPPGR
jgi:capsular polysaccharide export protein